MTCNKFLAVIAVAVPLAFAETPWRQSDFIIGTSEDPCLSGNLDPDPADTARRALYDSDRYNYQFCKNAYFNLVSGHNHLWDGSPCDTPVLRGQEKTDYALHIAAEAGLKSMVNHEPWASCNCSAAFLPFMRTENTSLYKSYKNYAEYIIRHYKNLGASRHAALQGYFVAAEPGPGRTDVTCGSDGFTHGIDTLKMWVRDFKINDPEKQSHVFIFPSGSVLIGTFSDSISYKAHIDTVYNDADTLRRPQVICSNSYPIWDPKLRPIENNFFWGLNTCRNKAGGRPFWNHAHCIVTYRDGDAGRNPRLHTYITPDEAVLRWNAMTNVAHGVRGIIWYAYRGYNKNFGVAGNFGEGIVDCGNRSPLIKGSTPQRTEYDAVREINRYLSCIVGPAIMTSDFVNVYHKKQSGPGADGSYSVFPGQSCISAAQILQEGASDPILLDISNDNVMAGVFRDRADTSVLYLLVVNKNWKAGARPVSGLSLTFKGNMDGKVFCAPRAFGYDGGTAFTPLPATFRPGQGTSSVTLPGPLLSGEGRLVKVIVAGSSPALPAGFRPGGGIAAAQNNVDKRIICCARGTDGRVYARVQDTADVDFWGNGWRLIDNTQTASAVICGNAGSPQRIGLFSTTLDGDLQYTFQSRPQDKAKPLLFKNWQTLLMPQKINGRITCSAFGASGEYCALFFRCGNTLYYAFFDKAMKCRGPYAITQVDTAGSGAVGIGRNCQGTDPGSIDIFLTGCDKRLRWGRLSVSSLLDRTMPPFIDLGCTTAGRIVVETGIGNALEVFFTRDNTNRLSRKKQRTPGGTEWDSFDEETRIYGSLSVGRNSDGRIELFTQDSAGYLCHLWQQAVDKPHLGPMVRLGPGPITVEASPVAVAANGDGRLTVFALSSGNANVFYSSQGKKGCGTDWQNCLPFTNISDQDR